MRNSGAYTFTNTQYWKNKYYDLIEQVHGEKLVFAAFSYKLQKQVVIKVIPGSSNQDKKYIEREQQIVSMLMKLVNEREKCCNVVEFYDVFKENGNTFIVMEKCEGILDINRKYTEKSALCILQQIVNGYIWLLEVFGPNFIHRDLKPENILIIEDKYKIADFGYSRLMLVDDLTTNIGTQNYMAPEILRSQQYSNQCDVFSLGKIICSLLFNKDEQQTNLAYINNDYLRALIKQMLQEEPHNRITWQQLKDHDFMKENHDQVLNIGYIDERCLSGVISDLADFEGISKISKDKINFPSMFITQIKLQNQNKCKQIEKINQLNILLTQVFKKIEKNDEYSNRLLFALWIKILDNSLQQLLLLQQQDKSQHLINLELGLKQILEIIQIQQLIRIKNKVDYSIEFMEIEELCQEIQKQNFQLDESSQQEEFNQILQNKHLLYFF